MNLSNKVVVITGGTRMGSALAQAFAQNGCSIAMVWHRSKDPLVAIQQRLAATGTTVELFQCDLANELEVESVFSSIYKRFSRIDVLIHLASIYEKTTSFSKNALESLDSHYRVNARGAYIVSRVVAPYIGKNSEGGRIVHVGDWTSASRRPRYKDYTAYYVSKAALQALTEALALEWAPKILVNAIAPGPMIAPVGLTTEEHEAVVRSTPLGRWGGAEEIARTAIFLCQTEFITGETIRVDGGRHLY